MILMIIKMIDMDNREKNYLHAKYTVNILRNKKVVRALITFFLKMKTSSSFLNMFLLFFFFCGWRNVSESVSNSVSQ